MRKEIPLILSLFSVAFLIRVVNISNVCMYGDEWIYASEAYLTISSNFAPCSEVFKYANPFLSYIGAVVILFFGGDLNTLRMISVVFGSLTIPMLYLFGKAMYDKKTGLLSALFLCFSAFHCLRSRIFMFEALTLFFITAFLYFFWVSQRSEGRKSTTYACLAGAIMGLAIDAKYISLFLIPAVLAYVLWTRKFSFKALLDKRIFLTFIFAFLLFLPLLIGLYMAGVGMYPFYYQAVERFEGTSLEKITVVGGAIRGLPIDSLLVRGTQTILDMLCRGAEMMLSWSALFQLSTILLFIMTLLSYLPAFINKEKEGSFLIISFLIFYAFLFIGCSRHGYYVIYSLPFYFVMLSHFALKSFEHLRENNYKNIFRIFIILLFSIVLFSSIITGVTSPYWDEGDTSWAKSGVEYVKRDVDKSGYEGDILIGIVTLHETIDYPLHFSSDINAFYVVILVTTSNNLDKLGTVDFEKIDMLKPGYLLMNEPMYELYFKGSAKKEILEDYKVAFHYKTYPDSCYILKRKNMEPPELIIPTDGKDGEISRDIFNRSVPGVMKVGKVYTAVVQVKNTGDSRTNFTARVHSDEYTIFVDKMWGKKVTLNKGSISTLKFKIVPFREYAEELPITVDLYARDEENETYEKVDSFSSSVYRIEK